ncbi:MAG: resolvase [Cyanobacteria bacterium P01_F01_bin.33]
MSATSFAFDFPARTDAYVGFDPGRDKCGVALLTGSGEVCYREIVPSDRAIDRVRALIEFVSLRSASICVVMGNQTTSAQWTMQFRQAMPHLDIQVVDERYSSQEARRRYWDFYPPPGLTRFVPLGLREPPRPIDDIAAVILVERYLHQRSPTS